MACPAKLNDGINSEGALSLMATSKFMYKTEFGLTVAVFEEKKDNDDITIIDNTEHKKHIMIIPTIVANTCFQNFMISSFLINIILQKYIFLFNIVGFLLKY